MGVVGKNIGVATVALVLSSAAASQPDDSKLLRDLKTDIERPLSVTVQDQEACSVTAFDSRMTEVPRAWEFSQLPLNDYFEPFISGNLISQQLVTSSSRQSYLCRGRTMVDPTERLLRTAIGSGCSQVLLNPPPTQCYHVYKFGSLKLRSIKPVNTYSGLDRATGATTTFRSYNATIAFEGIDPFLPAGYPLWNCIFAFKLNQVDLTWKYERETLKCNS